MKRLAVAVLLLMAGCSDAAPSSEATVELREFAVDVSASSWRSEGTTVSVRNTGEFGHTLLVTSAAGDVVGSVDLLAPGASTTLSLDLPPGAYELTCRIVVGLPDGTTVDHYEAGMSTGIDVAG
ncbi:MAG: hypothetical protein R3290_00080 [Acidimicrobiia bacterium]|nr:hypothetical protein [Acidimicrobiia bacterium]